MDNDTMPRSACSFLLVSALCLDILALSCSSGDPNNDSPASTLADTAEAPATGATSATESNAGMTSEFTMPTSSTRADTSGSTNTGVSTASDDQGGRGGHDCDNWAQDCPEGQKCVVYASGGVSFDATKCVDVTGQDKPGDECTSEGAASGIDSCIKGAMCWDLNQDGVGTCEVLCTGTAQTPKCTAPAICTINGGGVLNLCLGCDPLIQDCADPNEGCYQVGNGFTCAPDSSGDEGQANDSCLFINDCEKGLVCAAAAFVGTGCEAGLIDCCTALCKFPDDACPNPDQQCLQFFDPAELPPNDPLLDVGVCGVLG